MKLTEAKLKTIIAEQAIVSLMEQDRLIDALLVYANNQQLLDENIFTRLVPDKFTDAGVQRMLKKAMDDFNRASPAEKRKTQRGLGKLAITYPDGVNQTQAQHAKNIKLAEPTISAQTGRTISRLGS